MDAHHSSSTLSAASTRELCVMLAVATLVWSVNGVYLSALSAQGMLAFWSADLLQWILLPGLIAWRLASRHRLFPVDYGFTPAWPGLRLLLWTLVAGLTLQPAFFGVRDLVAGWLGTSSGFFVWQDTFPSGAMGKVALVYSALTAGFVESALFIGLPWLLWQRLCPAQHPAWFVLVTALIFAGVHWEQGPHVVAGALAFHLVACGWFLALKSLWPVVLAHVGIDLLAFDE